jgi:hypothetical protein
LARCVRVLLALRIDAGALITSTNHRIAEIHAVVEYDIDM